MTERQVNLNTKYLKGWTARVAVVGGIDELVAGEGIDITQKTISLTHIPGVAGSYTNPTIQVDNYGRIVDVENGTSPEALGAEVVPTAADVETYSGDAVALVALDAGEGRSALYLKNEGGTFDGPAYLTGSAGRNGADGVNGVDGEKGEKGDKGDQGERGVEGPQGPRGLQGETGPRGADGLQGAEGPQGPQGAMGPTGSALVPNDYGVLDDDRITAIRNRPGNYFFLVQDGGDSRTDNRTPTGIAGDMSRHVIGWNGVFFTDYGPLTGAQGVQGPQGVPGPQGERGPQGVQGIQGNQGPQGAQGERGIAGQNGSQGIQGPKGDKGDTGEKGDKGDAAPLGQTVHTWTASQRNITSADNGSLFRLNGVPSVSVVGSLPADGAIDFANVGDSVCVVNYGSGASVKLYPGDLWRLSSSYNLFMGRRPKVLLASVNVASPAQNTLQIDVPVGAVNDFDRLQIEVEGIAPVSSSTLHMNTVDTVADNAWGTAHPVAQNQNLSPAHIVITVREGRQPITVVGTLEATTYHFSTTIHKGAARNPNRFRFIYGTSPGVNLAANGGRVRVFGMDRVV